MIRNLAAAGLLALSACPYDELAANATPGDGGLWFGDPNDDGVFVPQDPDAGGVIYLTKAPSTATLCKLIIGDYSTIEMGEQPRFLGTWIGDVESKAFFGPPSANAEQLGIDSATLSYHWPDGGIILSFKWIQAWDRQYEKTSHAYSYPWPKSFFLSDIAMEGDPPFQDCWRGQLGYPGQLPCPDCTGSGDKLFTCQPYPCGSKEIRDGK